MILLLLAFLGLSLVHEPEMDAATPHAGPPWAPDTAVGSEKKTGIPPEVQEERQGEVKTDGGP